MKTLKVIFSTILVLAFFGCQESLINQPEVSLNKEPSQITKGEINICCGVLDPITGECKINGQVTYIHNILEYQVGVTKVEINIEMNSELCTRLMNCRKCDICGSSVDTLFLSEGGKLLLDKDYCVAFRPDLRLCVQYLVTTDRVGITQMNLLQIVN